MYLLEHDAKQLLAAAGIAVPDGTLIESEATLASTPLPIGPWVVKAQVAAGGRGKAGAIRDAATPDQAASHVVDLLGMRVSGLPVRACRVETRIADATGAYLSIAVDASAGGVRMLLAASGGMDIESLADTTGALKSAVCAPEHTALVAAVTRLAGELPAPQAGALADAGARLAQLFLEWELDLLEINPLFVRPDGSWVAGDAKMITDDNALYRQAHARALLKARAHAYPEAALKFEHGCDYVVVDADGELGLLTTGAGLSMMLIDELRAGGIRPYNFLDVRTGGLRGDATRLVHVLNWIADGRNVRAVLVNVFAGITHLGEFSRLLLEALKRTPQLKVPVVTRLIGNGLDEAREVLAQAGIEVEPDLARAIELVRVHLGRA